MPLFQHFEHLDRIDSTNDYLKSFVHEGVPRIVAAHEQTAGRGRFGRSWYSPAGEGLYVSFLFFPDWPADRGPFLNMISALAVYRTILEFAAKPLDLQLKRPNDVLIRGKKVCGILAELNNLAGCIEWAILGIGVNLFQCGFPEGLEQTATSLLQEGVRVKDGLEFCDTLTQQLESFHSRLESGDWKTVEEEYNLASQNPE